MKAKVVIAINTAWNMYNFRAGLIRALIRHGFEVVAAAGADEYVERLRQTGCSYIALPIDSRGTHPGRDLSLFWGFYRLFKRERPAVYLGYTIKPNIYGSLAARCLGIPVINTINGLGAVFSKRDWLNAIARGLYRVALARSRRVFFQNHEDMALFVSGKLVAATTAARLPGSGVDLTRFAPAPLPHGQPFRFLLPARMLWDKGIAEFVAAATALRREGMDAEFCLLGFLGADPAMVSPAQMSAWVEQGAVRYLGASDDVRAEIAQADCVVLPSYYREGAPRALLEGAAMARPVIAADSIGCREAVEDGASGYLCRPRDAADLADKMRRMLGLSPAERARMGTNGRRKIEREFDERIVIEQYLAAIGEVLA